MAMEQEKKVKPGDRLAIPAATYNSLIDMLRAYKRDKFNLRGGQDKSTIQPHNTIFIHTKLDSIKEAFKIFRVSGVAVDFQSDPYHFAKRPVMAAFPPETDNDNICITILPIGEAFPTTSDPSGPVVREIVPAVIAGYTLALVRLNNLTDEWANPIPDNIDYLDSSPDAGTARIIYWETLDGSTLHESGLSGLSPEVVLAVVNLIGSKFKASIRYKRDNNIDGCVGWDGTDPDTEGDDFSIINNNTYPTTTVAQINNVRKLFDRKLISGAIGDRGPQLYIPANTGRVVVDGRIGIMAFSPYIDDGSFSSYGSTLSGLYFDFNYDIISIDEDGNMIDTTLYDEQGNIEFHQSVSGDERNNLGLIHPQPVLSGQVYNGGGTTRMFGDWNNQYNAFFKTANCRLSLNVESTAIRLCFRVFPTVAYTQSSYIASTSGTDPILYWAAADRGWSGYQGWATYLDLFEVTKFGKCDIGQFAGSGSGESGGSIGSDGSVGSGGSIEAGSFSGF